ncbi:probable aspartic protease At2g35615 [Nymphaea colorata]|nr:probable aspartic protease At2g35615 [Nymphaea colorata]
MLHQLLHDIAPVWCTSNQLFWLRYSNGDKSTIEGILASETLLFDDGAGNVKLPGIVFGYVHSKGNPNPALLKVLGLAGLGGGPLSLSLVNQIGSFIYKKFAYCLSPYSNENNSMGQLKFGEDAEFSGKEEVQETPMAPGGSQGTYYVLNLTDISVGRNRLNIQFGGSKTTALLVDGRSIIIDLGTTLTFLAKDVFGQVANAVDNVKP